MEYTDLLLFVLFCLNGWVCFVLGSKSVSKEPFFENRKIEIHSPPEEVDEQYEEEDPIQI